MELEDMEEIIFGCCGATAWYPRNFMVDHRKTGESFYCPNGHSRVFRETTADRLQKELDATKKSLEQKSQKLQALKSGDCPFCWKTGLKDVSEHIKRMHG